MKIISILGSTGSIGTQTLDIVRENKDLQVAALAARSNIRLLKKQILEFHPRLVCVFNPKKAAELKQEIRELDVKVTSGMEGLMEIAVMDGVSAMVTALVGMIGIRPTIAAIYTGKDIALANKETLVAAGHLIMPMAKEKDAQIFPVDSEHSAIFQSLNGEKNNRIEKILLTASGGPFRGMKTNELHNVQVEDALKHPNWSMGRKITIDSATLVNKGLEVIEAKWLFGVSLEQIQVVVHPQSIIHSMVQYIDGGIIAQMGVPNMKLPIQYALFYPKRRYMGGERIDFHTLQQITFEAPDMDTFQGLRLAYMASNTGGSMPTIYNAANELAVSKFLDRKIKFLEIAECIQYSMECHKSIPNPSIEQILDAEQEAYESVESRC